MLKERASPYTGTSSIILGLIISQQTDLCKFALNSVLSICLEFWLTYFQANVGQDEDFDAARKKATKLGAKKVDFAVF